MLTLQFTPTAKVKMEQITAKVNTKIGTYLHAFWECPVVSPFWTDVIKNLEKWIGLPIPASPQMCLLGDKSLLPPGFTMDMYGLAVAGFIVATRLILRVWKSPHGPRIEDWFGLMTETGAFERLISKVNNTLDKTNRIWSRFLSFVGSNSSAVQKPKPELRTWQQFPPGIQRTMKTTVGGRGTTRVIRPKQLYPI
uniref:Uncharacterized protein n=1 Tax=Periophthalmus magnuspinnatus TaxID=409849 RepID=A0A3B4A9L7_9GOBI